MINQGFKPRKLNGSLSTKLRKFQELYHEIMEEIHPRSETTGLRSLSSNTFAQMVNHNFSEEKNLKPEQSLYSNIT